jgi:hypothetical protein
LSLHELRVWGAGREATCIMPSVTPTECENLADERDGLRCMSGWPERQLNPLARRSSRAGGRRHAALWEKKLSAPES